MNSSLAGVFERALAIPEINVIYGAINGIEGVINGDLVPLNSILTSKEDIELLKNTPSTVLGSCRSRLGAYDPSDSKTEAEYMKIVNTFEEYNIKAFFYIGGGDSMEVVMNLDRYCKAVGKDVNIIGIPKNIENDLPGTDHSPGFGSAAKYIAATLQEIIRDSRVYSSQSITIVEIMGKNSGWLTASSCVLRANGEPAPHLIYIPEGCPGGLDMKRFKDDVSRMMKRYRAVMIAVSEGIFPEGGERAGAARKLADFCTGQFGCKVRSVELSVMQRCSAHIASKTDIEEAHMIGAAALEYALSGGSGSMMSFKRISSEPYRVEIIPVDAKSAVNGIKPFPENCITDDRCDVTPDALRYFLPLIQGESVTEYRNGIPVHFRINR